MNNKAAYSVKIHGRVQGVGFRYSAQAAANRLEIGGWVKNDYGGTVSLYCEGNKENVEEFVSWCKQGPPSAVVTDVELQKRPYSGKRKRFSITF